MDTTHIYLFFIVQNHYVVGIGSGTTIVYAVERLGKLSRFMC